jgi:hypothetical protein
MHIGLERFQIKLLQNERHEVLIIERCEITEAALGCSDLMIDEGQSGP